MRRARGQLFVEAGALDDFQRFQAGRHGHGVARQSARLIHAAQRRNAVHDFFFSAHGRHGHPAADDFAHRGHVGRDAVQRLRAAQRHAEACHHLVVNQHCAVLCGGLAQGSDEFGAGAHQVHIARDGFQNHAGNLAGEFVKGLFQRGNVVIRQDDGVLRQIGGNACGAGIAEGEQAGTGFDQQAVGVAVVAALEFDDFVSPRVAARQTDGGHGGFRAGRYQAQAFDAGHDFGNFFGNEDFGFRGRAERQAVHRGFAHGFYHFRVCVSDNARAP